MNHPIFSWVPTNQNGLDYDWLKSNGSQYGLLVTEDGDGYIVVKMVSREQAMNTLPEWWKYRSLFIDTRLNIVICRTLDAGRPNLFDRYEWDDIIIEEYVEGTQIQVFWDCRNRVWSFGTRGRMDLGHKWSGNRTFLEMFIELVDLDNLVDKLNTDYCYSFSLQHPDNPIIVPCELPRIVHIETRNMRTDRCEDIDIGVEKPRRFKLPREYEDSLGTLWDNIPQSKNWGEDLQRYIDTCVPWQTGGYMIWNSNHTERYHIMPDSYRQLRMIMDSVITGNMRYRFLALIKDERWGDIKYIIEHISDYEADYLWANSQVSWVIKMVYELYRDIYVYKRLTVMTQSQWMSRHLLYRIHGIYMDRAKRNETRDIDIFDIIEAVLHKTSRDELWSICSVQISN